MVLVAEFPIEGGDGGDLAGVLVDAEEGAGGVAQEAVGDLAEPAGV